MIPQHDPPRDRSGQVAQWWGITASSADLLEDEGSAARAPEQVVAGVAEVEVAGPVLVELLADVGGEVVGEEVVAGEQGDVVAGLDAEGGDALADEGVELGRRWVLPTLFLYSATNFFL